MNMTRITYAVCIQMPFDMVAIANGHPVNTANPSSRFAVLPQHTNVADTKLSNLNSVHVTRLLPNSKKLTSINCC